MGNAEILQDRAVISLEGPDAPVFLQGLITNDLTRCAAGQAIYAALLTPQGKILFDFFVLAEADRLLLDCASSLTQQLTSRLGLYRLRARVAIIPRQECVLAAVWGTPASASPGVTAFADPRLPLLGARLLGERNCVESVVARYTPGDYDAFRLQLGVPDSRDLPPDQVFALDAGMEELRGVSFTKGCYVGQEVTARMKHRSTARRRFYIVEADKIPPPGTVVEADGRELGRITSGKDGIGLALVRVDRIAEAHAAGTAVKAGGSLVRLKRPDWLHE